MNKKFFYAEIAAIGIFLTPLIYLQDPPQYGVDIFRNFLMFFFTKTLPLIVICLSMLRLIRTTMQRITFPFLGTVVASVLWTFLIFIWYGVRHAGPIAIFMLSIPFNLAFLLIFSIIDRFYETKFARILTHVIFTVSATWFVYLTYGNITVAIPERNRVAGIKQHALQILNEMNALCGSDTVCRFAIV